MSDNADDHKYKAAQGCNSGQDAPQVDICAPGGYSGSPWLSGASGGGSGRCEPQVLISQKEFQGLKDCIQVLERNLNIITDKYMVLHQDFLTAQKVNEQLRGISDERGKILDTQKEQLRDLLYQIRYGGTGRFSRDSNADAIKLYVELFLKPLM